MLPSLRAADRSKCCGADTSSRSATVCELQLHKLMRGRRWRGLAAAAAVRLASTAAAAAVRLARFRRADTSVAGRTLNGAETVGRCWRSQRYPHLRRAGRAHLFPSVSESHAMRLLAASRGRAEPRRWSELASVSVQRRCPRLGIYQEESG